MITTYSKQGIHEEAKKPLFPNEAIGFLAQQVFLCKYSTSVLGLEGHGGDP